jgi:hypothetical protein
MAHARNSQWLGPFIVNIVSLQVIEISFGRVSVKHGPPLGGGYVRLKLKLEPSPTRIRLADLESAIQPGSAAKAVFTLERSCPMSSMAPVLAIM